MADRSWSERLARLGDALESDPVPAGWSEEEWAAWHEAMCPPIEPWRRRWAKAYEPGDVLGQTAGLRGPLLGRLADEAIIIDDPVKFPDAGDRYQWPGRPSWGLADAPLWAKIIGYSFVAVLAIVGGLALGILVLFLVSVLQALLDVVVH